MNNRSRLVTVIIVALLIPIIPFVLIGELPGEQWLETAGDNSLYFGLASMGLLASDMLLPIPSSIIGTLLGARLGFVSGFFWCLAGLMLGNLIGYGVGRLFLRRFSADVPQTPTLLLLFASRAVPVLAEAIAVSAGATKLPLLRFVWTAALGNAIYAAVLAGNGAALLPDSLLGPGLIIPMALPLLTWAVWHIVEGRKARLPR